MKRGLAERLQLVSRSGEELAKALREKKTLALGGGAEELNKLGELGLLEVGECDRAGADLAKLYELLSDLEEDLTGLLRAGGEAV